MSGKRNFFATKKELEQKYFETKSIYKLAEFYKVNYKTVMSLMNVYEIERTTGSQGARKHFFNENYFETIDSNKKAYWLGFIMADGCVYVGSNANSLRLQINLSPKYKFQLERFQKEINSNYKIQDKTIKTGNVSILKINSTKMCNDLIKLGVVFRKTIICEFPNIQKKYYSHFIRGYFDGDGCMYINEQLKDKEWSIVGGIKMLTSIKKELEKNGADVFYYKLKHRISEIYVIRAGSYKSIYNIYNYLYKDADCFMEYKKENFEKVFAMFHCPCGK